MDSQANLPPIPDKRYFTIGEVSKLCDVKPHVLRYWEQEFNQLEPVKRRGNRRYYQRHDIELVRAIRELLYDKGFTIKGAIAQLSERAGDLSSLEDTPVSVSVSVSAPPAPSLTPETVEADNYTYSNEQNDLLKSEAVLEVPKPMAESTSTDESNNLDNQHLALARIRDELNELLQLVRA